MGALVHADELAGVELRLGSPAVAIDRAERALDLPDLHLPLRPGTDAWLLNGMLVQLDQVGCHDEAFVDERTQGLEAALAAA